MHEGLLAFYFLEEEFPVIEQDAASSPLSPSQLDELTSGAFSATTSTERAQRLRAWIDSNPSIERMQEVFKEMSARDKGAAKPLREKIDELKKLKTQETLTQDWVSKAELILSAEHLNLVDALAWVRDAAKAGAPLSKEPLAHLKAQMAEKIKRVEDLEHRSQVQREAAVLLAQRIEVLSTKPWQDALAQQQSLDKDVKQWFVERDQITADPLWASVDPKHSPLMLNSGQQLQAVWDAFDAALVQTQKASLDASEAPPLVPAWAEQIKATRADASPQAAHAPRAKVDPEQKAKATEVVQGFLKVLEAEVSEGHGKASASAALDLKNALRENARMIDEKLEQHAQSVLAAANELEGWQRWRADQIRTELLAKAEGLFKRVPAKTPSTARVTKVTRAEGKKKIISPDAAPQASQEIGAQSAPPAEQLDTHDLATQEDSTQALAAHAQSSVEPQESGEHSTQAQTDVGAEGAQVVVNADVLVQEIRTPLPQEMTWVPVVGGRKMQEILRDLREQWKQTDQGGLPNHALWKKFDQACNRAYKVVEVWQEKIKKEGAEHKAQRLALIEEVKAFAQTKAQGPEWKVVARQLHQYSERWRESGHVSERVFAELQPMWKEAMRLAHEPLEKVQAASIERRNALIEEAKVLGAENHLRIDAVKNLQQRWQQESQSVLLDRKQEQKLWDLFREPIDAAFNRKTQQREQNMAALSAHDEAVVRASKALEEAVRLEDAKLIKERMQALDAALRGQSDAQSEALKASAPQALSQETPPALAQEELAPSVAASELTPTSPPETADVAAPEATPEPGLNAEAEHSEAVAPAPAPAPKAPAKPVVAVRGDDRPGQKPGLAQASAPSKDARPSKGGLGRGPKDHAPGKGRREFEGQARPSRFDDAPRGPRLSDAAFRVQRQALESAQQTLRKLSAMAHGESLMQLMSAWEHRDVERVPALRELSPKLSPADRQLMVQSLQSAPKAQAQAATSILRLEMASEVPTPAQFLSDRRALQLQLLTRRNDPSPVQTWTRDVAQVLETPFDAQVAQRLQNTLKVLLKK